MYIVFMATVFTWLSGCQQPEELIPPVSREGVNSITASFEDGTGEFTGTISETGDEIIIPVPYYFPESSNQRVMENDLKNMRVSANLDDNVTLSPSLLYMDLTQDNVVTITDQRKETKQYTVRGEIRKLSYAGIEEFEIPSLGLSGVINEEAKKISLISVEDIVPALAEVKLSYHATISPDPSEVALDYNKGVEVTVTAHDGVTKNVYTIIKEIPEKLPYGIRSGSAKILFAKQLEADLGITVDNLTGGIAVTGDYLMLNTSGHNNVYINAKSGEKVGEVDLGAVKGEHVNFYSTADDSGNILINNLTSNGTETFDGSIFKVWKLASVMGTVEPLIEWDAAGLYLGGKISVQGNINENAIITAPIQGAANQKFARWTVVGGVLSSQTPEIVTMSGLVKGWTTNADIIYTSPSDITSDYFVASYSDNTFAWVDGATNSVSKKLAALGSNFVPNAVDYVEFNNAKYVVTNYLNSFTWGGADDIWLLDVSNDANFSGNLSSGTVDAIVWRALHNTYGPKAIPSQAPNSKQKGDVALSVSSNGFYMYLYFMFGNGYVVGVQFDAIDM